MNDCTELELEYQYKLYLEKVRLSEDKMNPIQKIETKRAFYAGMSQMLLLMRDNISAIEDEDKAILVMEDLLVQCEIFWNEQI